MSSKTYRGIKVFKLSSNFDEATKIVDMPLNEPANDEILVKNIYLGINATDLNITAGRYFAHDPVPYPLGIEVNLFLITCIWLFITRDQSLGQIVKTGNHVEKFKSGEYVVVKCAKIRAYSEYLVQLLTLAFSQLIVICSWSMWQKRTA